MKILRTNSSQHGFTLIELMIAMLIGVFLMAGVIQVFLSAKQAYRLQENLSRLQENGRFALDMITKDIRMAGYVSSACIPPPPTPMPAPVAFAQADSTWCNSRSCVPKTASNTITIGGVDIRTDVIRSYQWGQLNPPGCPVNVAANPPTCPLANVGSCPPTAPPTANSNQSEISYFIRGDDTNNNMPALWRYDGTTSQERIEGIEAMQILYGVDTSPIEDANNNGVLDGGEDTNGNGVLDYPDYIPNYYVDASKIPTTVATGVVADWSRVVSVRITLLAVTLDNNLTDDAPQPFLFNGTTYGTIAKVCSNNGVIITTAPLSTTDPTCSSPNQLEPDLRIRRVFSSTIAVRNRLP